MIIPIRAPDQDANTLPEKTEYVMIELNGELLRPLDESPRSSQATLSTTTAANDSKRRVELGSVKFDPDGAPTMVIGNHELKGSAINLKEPFAVLRKRKIGQVSTNNKLNAESGVQLEVVGVVKKKLMFDQYPKSIMR